MGAELDDIAQQEQVDQRAETDARPVENEAEQEQDRVDNDVQRAVVDRDQGVETAHQSLKGVNAENR